jgi:chromate transport protein ChrA
METVKPTPPQLLFGFAQLSLQGFGGVGGQARHFLVRDRRWMTEDEFAELSALCQALPGPNTGNLALMLGDRAVVSAAAGLVIASGARIAQRLTGAPLFLIVAAVIVIAIDVAHVPLVVAVLVAVPVSMLLGRVPHAVVDHDGRRGTRVAPPRRYAVRGRVAGIAAADRRGIVLRVGDRPRALDRPRCRRRRDHRRRCGACDRLRRQPAVMALRRDRDRGDLRLKVRARTARRAPSGRR